MKAILKRLLESEMKTLQDYSEIENQLKKGLPGYAIPGHRITSTFSLFIFSANFAILFSRRLIESQNC